MERDYLAIYQEWLNSSLLNEEEKAEQFALRREYIEAYKKSLIAQLDNMYIVEPDGYKHKIHPKKDIKS